MLTYCKDYNIDGAIRVNVSGDRDNLSWAVFDRAGNLLQSNEPAFFAPGLTEDETAEARKSIAAMHDAPFAGEVYIRFNDIPQSGKSINHATGKEERGVSCYRAIWDYIHGCYRRTGGGLDGAAIAYILSRAPIYLITGEEIDVGSDGEPILANTTILSKLSFGNDDDGYVPCGD